MAGRVIVLLFMVVTVSPPLPFHDSKIDADGVGGVGSDKKDASMVMGRSLVFYGDGEHKPSALP